ncbi:single-stranded-DNA-specific exonuclease RecJ [Rickettsiales endosymbiont of Stachyamoeba lipophora]|uniref:single-stranded-DNA-specific exonuclease RecJ n=1 Tax=Rickettsiales endosymbiont of Stachyamoeba lipophora TaxID=2486578 RepID=UPI000F654890|nr:single-stranded-DNA-specific exonuclease RecJ [Rickettsiales endosymbiont of Stachyamoeba lipophora]AZL15061.1 single-stranded-DNA-specific exonuclease RecJ [Rickettsiales endosymbiont of Stachyamoeba lipophora]
MKKSIKGAYWCKKEQNQRDLLFLSQKYNLNPLAAEIVLSRLDNIENAEEFLNPRLKDHLPNPDSLLDMQKASKRVVEAIMNNQKLVVFGDYDVDGATSSALLARFFDLVGYSNYQVYIPDRIKEGYGPNLPAFQNFVANGVKVVITVDCGTLSFEPIEYAADNNLDVIVLDHHLSDVILPKAWAVVNPNRLDETFPHRNLAAVGVSFLFLVSLNRFLREEGFFQNKKEPNLVTLLDLVALGTVCDVMTLMGVNRLFLSVGLKILLKRQNLGLAALMDVAGINSEPNVYHLGYILGPRINAGGRVGKADLGSRLLRSLDYDQAHKMAVELNEFNNNRKSIEQLVLEEAIVVAERHDPNVPLLFVSGDNWHPGVIGIVCARIKEKHNKPTAIIAFDDQIGKASLRSVPGIDIGAAVVAAKNSGLLMAGGGHAMAAGFTIQRERLEDAYKFMLEYIAVNQNVNNVASKFYDIAVTARAVNHKLYEIINCAHPYGNGNEEPLVQISNLKIVKVNQYKNDVVKLILTDELDPQIRVSATLFKAYDSPIGEYVLNNYGSISLVGKLSINSWNGRDNIEILVEDVI